THAEVGPGPVLCAVVAIAWGLCAFSVCRQRPNELLGFLMACGATVGAVALLSATMMGRAGIESSTRSVGAAGQAFGLTLVFAISLHVVLGLPDGMLTTTGRRVIAGLGYVASIGVGVYLYTQRPDLPLTPLVVLAVFDVIVGVTGFVARCQRATVAERPRLQWCVWGALTATAIAVAALVLKALVDWPNSVLAVSVAGTIVVPFALALGA